MSLAARARTRSTTTAEIVALLVPAMLFAAMACSVDHSSSAHPPDPRPPSPDPRSLRICADPNNLPFSNARGEGFENKIADVVAREMRASVSYTWWAQRRGFIRNTLGAGACDVVLGMPAEMTAALTTRPYYRSSYVFVSRSDRRLHIRSFDDPALRQLRIGVQLIGDDYANTPPAHALSSRHLVGNVTGYTVYGNYAEPNPPARIMDAVSRGDVDVAIVWGPLAGYFATRERVPLDIVPVSPPADLRFLPFTFDIAMAVRRGDVELRDELDAILARVRPEIERILDTYGVPRAAGTSPPRAS
jgi:quinoprotein dehydrogenase-associated probable ABC transporter substrate-binding protein